MATLHYALDQTFFAARCSCSVAKTSLGPGQCHVRSLDDGDVSDGSDEDDEAEREAFNKAVTDIFNRLAKEADKGPRGGGDVRRADFESLQVLCLPSMLWSLLLLGLRRKRSQAVLCCTAHC